MEGLGQLINKFRDVFDEKQGQAKGMVHEIHTTVGSCE